MRRLLSLALVAAGLAVVPLAQSASAAPPTVPTGFKAIAYDAGMFEYDLTNFAVLPGNAMLATGKSGRITRVDIAGDGMDPSDASSTILGNLPTYYQGDRGLLGLSLANDFSATRHVFLLWDYCQSTTLASDDQSCIPDGGLPTGRLSRFTLTGTAAAPTGIDFTSEVVLIDNLPSWSPTPGATCTDSHTIGTVVTAPDGTLYVGNGDGSGYCGAMDPSSLAAQDIFSPRGKIFHINPDGSPVATNPFIDAKINGQNNYPVRDEYWAQRVFAYGFRNPFRFSYLAGNLLAGDVGWNSMEEQDSVTKGSNYGWPCLEGTLTTSLSNSPQCNASFASPMLTWNHVEVGRPAQSAAIGGVMAPAGWAEPYGGEYFFGDYARGDLFYGSHNTPFGALGQWGAITSIQQCFGDLCVSDIGRPGTGPGKITRIHYLGGTNAVPTVSIAGGPLTGKGPLNVAWSVTATDTDGTIHDWSWDYGDGSPLQVGLGTPPFGSHTYTQPGSFKAVLTVTDNGGASASATQTVNVGDNPPVIVVNQAQGFFHVGDNIVADARVTDPDPGDTVTVQYQPVIHHCPSPGDCHVHPGAFQDSPAFVFPDHGTDSADYYLEVVVRATDNHGAVATASANFLLSAQTPPEPPPPPPPGQPVTPGAPIPSLRYNPQPPHRLVDTRVGDETLRAETPISINLAPHKAAMLTVTVTNPAAAGYLRVYPCTQPGGLQTSTVNYNAGQTVANATIVTIPNDGWICFWSLHATDLVVDLSGTYDATGLGYTPITPLRVLDTRPGIIGAMQQVVFNFNPGSALQATMMNLTVDQPQGDGFVRAYPCAGEQNVSNVNYVAGQTVSNFVAVQAPSGTNCFRSYAATALVVDVAGYFTPTSGTALTAVDPTRLFDTRAGANGFTRLAPGQELRVALGLPNGAQAAVLNVTAADPSADGYIQAYPCGTSPTSSSVNYQAHQTAAANMTVVKVSPAGQVCFKSFAATDLIVDLSGWFS